MIRTTSKQPKGHWRAGKFHHPRGSEFHEDAFTDEQMEQLYDDPRLVVEELEGEPTGQPPARALPDAEAEGALAERERQMAEREQAVTERERAVEQMKQDGTFRAIALRYGLRRVVEGKAESDFLKDGKPRIEAISREALGIECSAKERDELFTTLQAPQ